MRNIFRTADLTNCFYGCLNQETKDLYSKQCCLYQKFNDLVFFCTFFLVVLFKEEEEEEEERIHQEKNLVV